MLEKPKLHYINRWELIVENIFVNVYIKNGIRINYVMLFCPVRWLCMFFFPSISPHCCSKVVVSPIASVAALWLYSFFSQLWLAILCFGMFGFFFVLPPIFNLFFPSHHCQGTSRVYQKHARVFMRTPPKHGEVWRTLANPQRHIQDKLSDIHQSSGEGPLRSPEFR